MNVKFQTKLPLGLPRHNNNSDYKELCNRANKLRRWVESAADHTGPREISR
jgi:hypothetical protein